MVIQSRQVSITVTRGVELFDAHGPSYLMPMGHGQWCYQAPSKTELLIGASYTELKKMKSNVSA